MFKVYVNSWGGRVLFIKFDLIFDQSPKSPSLLSTVQGKHVKFNEVLGYSDLGCLLMYNNIDNNSLECWNQTLYKEPQFLFWK